jgi:hypothetical protein
MTSLRRITHSAFFAATCAAFAVTGSATAFADGPTWKKPDAPKSLGFLAQQCDRSDFCFAIACPGSKLQLVNTSPGGGPYGTPEAGQKGEEATLLIAGKSYSLSFVWDDSILNTYGNAGSRAALPGQVAQALIIDDGRISGNAGAPRTATIFSEGLKALWPAIAKACKVQAPAKRPPA